MTGGLAALVIIALWKIGFRFGWAYMDHLLKRRKRRPIDGQFSVVTRPPQGGLLIRGDDKWR